MSPEESLNFGSGIDKCNFTSDQIEGTAKKYYRNFKKLQILEITIIKISINLVKGRKFSWNTVGPFFAPKKRRKSCKKGPCKKGPLVQKMGHSRILFITH